MTEHLTNIVLVAIIYDENNKIFVARRAATKAFHPNMFECVGGHLDPGETLEQGLRREVHEEIGCEIEIDQLFDAFTYEDEGMLKIELSYLCRLAPGEEPQMNSTDHSEFLWIGSDEIDKFEKEDEETVALRKAFKILQGAKV
jgi:mutator protein MutT